MAREHTANFCDRLGKKFGEVAHCQYRGTGDRLVGLSCAYTPLRPRRFWTAEPVFEHWRRTGHSRHGGVPIRHCAAKRRQARPGHLPCRAVGVVRRRIADGSIGTFFRADSAPVQYTIACALLLVNADIGTGVGNVELAELLVYTPRVVCPY